MGWSFRMDAVYPVIIISFELSQMLENGIKGLHFHNLNGIETRTLNCFTT